MSDTRPRGGQTWRRRSDGLDVQVQWRRKTRAPGSSENFWTLVLWFGPEGTADWFGCPHEVDFVREFEFVPASPLTPEGRENTG